MKWQINREFGNVKVRHHTRIANQKREQLADPSDRMNQQISLSGGVGNIASQFSIGTTVACLILRTRERRDVVQLFQQLIPRGVRKHNRQAGIGAHRRMGFHRQGTGCHHGFYGPRQQQSFSTHHGEAGLT